MTDIAEQRPRPRKMLIADDDPAILRLLADRCARMGFQVETAMNGVQLLVKVRHNHPTSWSSTSTCRRSTGSRSARGCSIPAASRSKW